MIEINKDVTFYKDATFRKSKNNHAYKVHEEEHEAPKVVDNIRLPAQDVEEIIPEYHDMAEPQIPMESPHEIISLKRIPAGVCDVIQYAEKYGAPEGSKRPRSYSTYVALMCNLADEEPTYFEEETKKKEWMDSMIKEC